ncbi:MAG: FAD-dependent oxidoreductase [Rickettsiales bacterium]|nr:FAD-dependent oxidoreductase [Rickettsiales bacterium]
MPSQNPLNSRFELTFEDLYAREGLVKLDQKFEKYLEEKSPEIAAQFGDLKNSNTKTAVQKSQILIDVARVLEEFLAELFNIEQENSNLKKRHDELQKIYQIRREFVQRDVSKKFSDVVAGTDGIKVLKDLKITFEDVDDLEKQLAEKISTQENLEILTNYTTWALYSDKGRALHKNGALFILPQKIDHQNLISPCTEKSKRDGFNLTDKGFELNRVLAETHYCIFCHKQEKDSCRSGIRDKETQKFKIDPLKVELHGCPLDEKISEMNLLKSEGFSLAAFAMAVIDNPMIAGTGHRICNDCMKSCIYQKQDAVDIPQIETRTLKDVLALPFGFEIYSLLTRWNPLNLERNLPKENSGKKILIAGLGPAGYTLAHHLLNDGHTIVAIDGLKIEPLNSQISGIDEFGNRQKFKPIKFLDEIYEPLSRRLVHGFGGVAEYGITVRFDKNFLKVIRLLLERRENFRMFGGIRFGSSITDKIAFENYGFDHVALCIGAGRPNIINLKNNFAKGVRSASDFLMSLQLTGAFKEELFTNLQIRMPIAVIGGGLTATDTACEAQAYYITQIRKFEKKFAAIGKEKIWAALNAEEKIIAEEFLNHAAELRNGDSSELLKKWGGVKILYRKKIQDSPAYRLNHQELSKAFAEGVEFVENITPLEVETDQFGYIKNLKCAEGKNFACKSLLVAAGTTPNIAPVLEDGLDFKLEGKYFKALEQGSVITKIDENSQKVVSFFGDLHPSFEGNVVKAMASAKMGYSQISRLLASQKPSETEPSPPKPSVERSRNQRKVPDSELSQQEPSGGFDSAQPTVLVFEFLKKINSEFLVKIEKIDRLSDHVVEVFIKAPLLAKQTHVGQIFRLQNYHALAPKVGDQLLAMEGVPVTALSIDCERGIISGIVLETGGSTSLIQNFKTGEPCIFMGPSGKPNEIPQNETVVLIGGGRGNQPLTALAEAYKQNGCRVIFFAGYRKNSSIVRQQRMENSCEILVCAIEEELPNLKFEKASNYCFEGSVIEALKNHFTKNPEKIDRIFTIGNDQMMHAVAKLRAENLVESISKAPVATASLNAPMQCMLKGVCSQCLQKRQNEKGEEEYFYSCGDQDQNMDRFDFAHLHNRCEQNSLAEKVSRMWIAQLR